MNKRNVLKAIAIMKRAKNLEMLAFQSRAHGRGFVGTEEELHMCGNTACFAGYIAISKEFKEDGGECRDGSPFFNGELEEEAIRQWLDISIDLASGLVYGEVYSPIPFSEVKPKHVIEKLELILSGELK